jgi:hypothetical protein
LLFHSRFPVWQSSMRSRSCHAPSDTPDDDCAAPAGWIGPRDLMPLLIVVFHRDPAQSTALRCALNGLVGAEVIVAGAMGEMLDVIDLRTPDLILVDPLIPPCEADDLAGYLALLPDASHVQTISAPVILPFAHDASPQVVTRHAWLRRMLLPKRRPRLTSPVVSWNPEAFATEVATYLSLSLTIKADNEERHRARDFLRTVERRQGSRLSAKQASLAQPVFVLTDRADLVNISSTGLLVRTETRPSPHLSRLRGGYPQDCSALTLSSASGDVIRRTGAPVWCRPKLLGDGRFLYEVAFRFDEPLDMESAMVAVSASTSRKY